MVKFGATFNTNGKGYWSTARKAVKTTSIALPYVNDEQDFGEMRVYFDNSWQVYDPQTKEPKDGLIYTDPLFLKELRAKLTEIGFVGNDVEYSEQGMQGDNYVSFDVGQAFISSWLDIVGVQVV